MAVNYSERERQRAAYDLLKAAGKKVKPRFEDYITGRGRNRSLINRAEKLGVLRDLKTFTNKRGVSSAYATYDTEFDPGIDPDTALSAADDMIRLYGRLFNRCQISMYGFAVKSPEGAMKWKHGVMARLQDATFAYRPIARTFEYVNIVRVYFRIIRQQ